jgi:hypothetical protein
MKQTPALEHAAHPLTLLIASLVLLNDLVLRPLWPASWWTGKLSTLAVAFVLPLFLAALLSYFLPRRAKLAPGLAFGLVLIALFLLKVSPQSNSWLTAWLPIRAVADRSDLLSVFPWLAALLFYFQPTQRPRPIPLERMLFLPIATLFLLADAAMPDYGAACLRVQDSNILTSAGYHVYLSNDGGRTWMATEQNIPMECYSPGLDGPVELSVPGGTKYRVNPGNMVERSADGIKWEKVYASSALSEPEQVYNQRTIPSNLDYQPGPLDAQVDPSGENLILAMGMEGILIVPPTGTAQWVAVGPYHHNSLQNAGLRGYLTVLGGEIWLAVAAALAWFATATLRLRRTTWQIVLTIIGWLLLAATGIAQHPSINTSYLAAFAGMGLLASCLWSLALVLIALIRLRGQPRQHIIHLVIFVPLVIIVFLLPYIAWATGLIPSYSIAQAAAAALTIAMVALFK